MKRYLLRLGTLTASCCIVALSPVFSDTEIRASEPLPEEVLGVVKASAPQELISQVVGVARKLELGPQAESLPFIVGGLLGDPMFQGISQTENVGLVFVATEGEPAPVLVLNLPEGSPWRETLPGFELQLRDAQGWTFAARDAAHLTAVEGLEETVVQTIRSQRVHDVELALNSPALASMMSDFRGQFLSELEGETRELADGFWDTASSEMSDILTFLVGLDLNEDEIAYSSQLSARPESSLGQALREQRPREIPYASMIPADGPMVYLGTVNMEAVLGYIEHLTSGVQERLPEERRNLVDDFLEGIRYISGNTDGTFAGAMGISGVQPEFLQVAGATFDQDELLEYMRQSIRVMSAFDMGDDEGMSMTHELLENHLSIGDIPVHVLRSETTFGPGIPEGEDSGMPGGMGMAPQSQDIYHALVDGLLVTGTDAGRLSDLIQAIQEGTEATGSIAERVSLGSNELMAMRADLVGYASGIMGTMMMGDEAAEKMKELEARNLPPASAVMGVSDNTLYSRMAVPVETIGALMSFFQETMGNQHQQQMAPFPGNGAGPDDDY